MTLYFFCAIIKNDTFSWISKHSSASDYKLEAFRTRHDLWLIDLEQGTEGTSD